MRRPSVLVGIIAPRYAPAIGGVERHTEALARGLAERNVRVEVITTDPGGQLPTEEIRDGVMVRRFRTIGPQGAYHVSPALGAWLLRNAGHFDVLHAHSYHALPALQAGWAAALHRVPLIFTPHYHGTGHTPLQRALHTPYRPFGRWIVKRAARIVCVSDVERRLLQQHFGASDSQVVIPNGVDIDDLLPAAPMPKDHERVLVLTVGRLEHYKQVERLVQALPHLPSHIDVVVVGDGPARQEIEAEAVRLGVTERVRVTGRLPQAELLAWYRAADVFVSMSLRESFGITLLEGAVAGAAVVASDIPAHREVAGYVPRGRIAFQRPACSPADLAGAIIEATGRGRTTGVDGWSLPTWSGMVDGMLRCYGMVTGGNGRSLPQGVTL